MLIFSTFALAVLLGYFVLPFFIKKERIHLFLSRTTSFETSFRDLALKFLTDRLSFTTPNAISAFGFVLVFILIYLFYSKAHFGIIFLVTLLAGFTDMLDGSLARNSGQITKLGAFLDVARDAFLTAVVSFFLIYRNVLSLNLFLWFIVGWISLGLVRVFEFRFAELEEDYKFMLDRLRLFSYIAGVLFLILLPLSEEFGTAGETLVIISVILSWFSLLLHSAHLKILKEKIWFVKRNLI